MSYSLSSIHGIALRIELTARIGGLAAKRPERLNFRLNHTISLFDILTNQHGANESRESINSFNTIENYNSEVWGLTAEMGNYAHDYKTITLYGHK